MKKARNVLVFGLMLATVASMGSVAGTYAKYTTSKTDTDSARVAKWGIGVTNEVKDLFKSSYAASDDADQTDVNSGDTAIDLVAPGTSGEYKFTLTGTPETNYTLKVVATATDTINGSVMVPAVEADPDNGVEAAEAITYSPITYTLDETEITDQNGDGIVDATDLAKAIEALYNEKQVYAANTSSASEHTIRWSWAIDGNDVYDTKLGDEIAADEDSHKVSLSIAITATQSELSAGLHN